MRGSVQRFARRWWAGELGRTGRALAYAAWPLSACWAGATSLVLRRRAARAVRVEGLAVVSVGNLAVGGTGKTPVAAWVADRLQALEARPAVVVGGHGADEAALHRRRLAEVPVFEDRDRVAAARRAREAGARVVVLDDGFQHLALARDLDVVLMAAEDAFPGPVLPAGPYREPARALERADLVLVTRRTASAEVADALAARIGAARPGLVAGVVELGVGPWTGLDGRPAAPPPGDVVAVSAIARPSPFHAALAARVPGTVEPVAFPDHHEYTPADVSQLERRARGRTIVTTEKDAVKLQRHATVLGGARVLSERLSWDWGEETVLERLRELVRSVHRA